MEVTSAKIDKRTKRKMKRFADINWSEVIRNAISSRIKGEELKRRINPLDKEELGEAGRLTDLIRAKHIAEGWDSVEEFRKWRDARK